ncbi:hypothetical protein B566_EDAN001052 [Ephemera danica]|nr:hypothetical protein B566_EDAN001052 [Ephemera danica]
MEEASLEAGPEPRGQDPKVSENAPENDTDNSAVQTAVQNRRVVYHPTMPWLQNTIQKPQKEQSILALKASFVLATRSRGSNLFPQAYCLVVGYQGDKMMMQVILMTKHRMILIREPAQMLDASEIEEAIKKRREECQENGVTLQPYIVAVRPNLANINSRYVVIENQWYFVESIVKAVDITFKAAFVFNASYQFECAHIWQFLHFVQSKIGKFQGLTSEHLVFKYLVDKGFLIPSVKMKTGTMYTEKRLDGTIKMVPVSKYAHFVSIRKMMKSFFELPGVFKAAFEFSKSVTNIKSPIYNIM